MKVGWNDHPPGRVLKTIIASSADWFLTGSIRSIRITGPISKARINHSTAWSREPRSPSILLNPAQCLRFVFVFQFNTKFTENHNDDRRSGSFGRSDRSFKNRQNKKSFKRFFLVNLRVTLRTFEQNFFLKKSIFHFKQLIIADTQLCFATFLHAAPRFRVFRSEISLRPSRSAPAATDPWYTRVLHKHIVCARFALGARIANRAPAV